MRFTKILGTAGVITLAALGAQIVAAQVASAHTPSASATCTTWNLAAQSYDAAQSNTYGYSVDGAAEVTGTFGSGFSQGGTFAAGSGNHTLVAHVYAEGAPPPAPYSQDYSLSTTGCAVAVPIPVALPIPAAPHPTGPTCTEAGAATVPSDTDTVHWSLSGNVAVATAQGGNHFADGTTTQPFPEVVLPKLNPDSADCAVHVSPQTPGITQSTCAVSGGAALAPTVTVLDTTNVSYALPRGPHAAPSTVIVTATAASGYEFTSAGLPAGWTLVGPDSIAKTATYSVGFAAAPLCGTAAAATFHDDVCRADGAVGASYTLVSSTGVVFQVDGIETAAGTYPAADGSTVTITAQPRPGYTLVGTTSWSHTFTAVPNCAHVSAAHLVTLPPAHQPTAVAATTVPLASTGVPTMNLLLIAGLLALVGGALCLGGLDRRSSRS